MLAKVEIINGPIYLRLAFSLRHGWSSLNFHRNWPVIIRIRHEKAKVCHPGRQNRRVFFFFLLSDIVMRRDFEQHYSSVGPDADDFFFFNSTFESIKIKFMAMFDCSIDTIGGYLFFFAFFSASLGPRLAHTAGGEGKNRFINVLSIFWPCIRQCVIQRKHACSRFSIVVVVVPFLFCFFVNLNRRKTPSYRSNYGLMNT